MTPDDALQLHEEITINYYVDHCEAVLFTYDRPVLRGSGDTIAECLTDLSAQLSKYDWLSQIRELEGINLLDWTPPE